MNIQDFREFCLSLPGTEESFPFDESTLVFKVKGKIFALTDVDLFTSVNLKCEPEKALELRDRYEAVQPGYHMNKKHWNTIQIDGSIPDSILLGWTKDSYDLVVASLPRKIRREPE
jgi:predicted DNA-binding protein (MmcQ/YjbR family)